MKIETNWEKIMTNWGIVEWGEVLELAKKARKDLKRAKSEKRKKFLRKLYSELSFALWSEKKSAQTVLNTTWPLFCRSYKCKNCPIGIKCENALLSVQGD